VTFSHHLETDASLNPAQRKGVDGVLSKRAGGGIVVRSAEMVPLGFYTVSLGFLGSVTLAEALTLLRGMDMARNRHHASSLRARTDAHSLVLLVNGHSKARDPALLAVVQRILAERNRFAEFEILWSSSSHAYERQAGVPTADALARKAAGLPLRARG
jgi:hypothetical protein